VSPPNFVTDIFFRWPRRITPEALKLFVNPHGKLHGFKGEMEWMQKESEISACNSGCKGAIIDNGISKKRKGEEEEVKVNFIIDG